ncbi:MAG: hypothetical protein KC766_11880, partial [Myxococcales bacterium]|nr:hypothetical protein [Myxococcales bacterium]
MTTYSAIDRYEAPRASLLITVAGFAFFFASCAFATYFVEDWFRHFPNLLEDLPEPGGFFWRPVTVIYAALCFYNTIRLWLFLGNPGAIPFPILYVPYLFSYYVPRTCGLWFML